MRSLVAAATPRHPKPISVSCVCRCAEARKLQSLTQFILILVAPGQMVLDILGLENGMAGKALFKVAYLWSFVAFETSTSSKRKNFEEFTQNEPFSTAERRERVENFLFRATHEHTEAGIEQATVAMRCHGANSPEPRRRAVSGSDTLALCAADTSALRAADTSALRAADQQLYNRISLTSWAHRGSLSKRRELVLSSLPTSPPLPFCRFSAPVSEVACLISLYLLSTCLYHTFSHITFLGYNHMISRAFVFLDSLLSEHIIRWRMCPWRKLLPRLQHKVFPPEGLLLSGQGGCSCRPYQG